jgi:hypothetical protein
MSTIQFGAVTLFTQSKAQKASKEVRQRFNEAIAAYQTEHGLKEEDFHTVWLPGNRRLVVDGDDFAAFGKDLILKERGIKQYLANPNGLKEVILGAFTQQQRTKGTTYDALERWVADDYAAKAGTRVIDLDA